MSQDSNPKGDIEHDKLQEKESGRKLYVILLGNLLCHFSLSQLKINNSEGGGISSERAEMETHWLSYVSQEFSSQGQAPTS